ncbi:hypothetical protein S7711_11068, partial [Stachybotrys chartarum IBT 7711]
MSIKTPSLPGQRSVNLVMWREVPFVRANSTWRHHGAAEDGNPLRPVGAPDFPGSRSGG